MCLRNARTRQNTVRVIKFEGLAQRMRGLERLRKTIKNYAKSDLKMFGKSVENHAWENMCKIMQNDTK